MSERRISYAKDKGDIVTRLIASEDSTGPFEYIADVLSFAAAVGLSKNRRVALGVAVSEPIRQSVFDGRGYDTLMNLLVLHSERHAEALGDSAEAIDSRATVFEEFANGGLEVIQEEIKGALDVTETIVLMISSEREIQGDGNEGFDLSKLMR